MGYLLDGRSLWFLTASVECLIANDDDLVTLKQSIISRALASLKAQNPRSIKLIATRCLIKYVRKMKKDYLQ